MKEEFPDWFGSQIRQRHVDKDPGISASSELFALACEPTPTPISVNSCVVNGVRFVVHSRDGRRTTQNNDKGRRNDDPDVIHYDNSSDLALSTSLNDLDFLTLHIDGQSTDVDAPQNIIDVDEDDDIIDDEDVLPYDLADSDDEDLVNVVVDDDDDVAMSADVARGHGGDGGGEDRPPSHQVPAKKKAGVLAKIRTQFDLKPHMESECWPKIYTGIQQHLQKDLQWQQVCSQGTTLGSKPRDLDLQRG
ncbi:hypothetical protein Tco_1314532 [Tanacetum coccineum]